MDAQNPPERLQTGPFFGTAGHLNGLSRGELMDFALETFAECKRQSAEITKMKDAIYALGVVIESDKEIISELRAALEEWREYMDNNGGDAAYSFHVKTRAALAKVKP